MSGDQNLGSSDDCSSYHAIPFVTGALTLRLLSVTQQDMTMAKEITLTFELPAVILYVCHVTEPNTKTKYYVRDAEGKIIMFLDLPLEKSAGLVNQQQSESDLSIEKSTGSENKTNETGGDIEYGS